MIDWRKQIPSLIKATFKKICIILSIFILLYFKNRLKKAHINSEVYLGAR